MSSSNPTPLNFSISSRRAVYDKENVPATPSTPTPATHVPNSLNYEKLRLDPSARKKLHRNGFVATPKTPSYTPYSVGRRPKKKLSLSPPTVPPPKVLPQNPLQNHEWNVLAHSKKLLERGQTLKAFQIEAANTVLRRNQDLAVIAPTGAGKSLLWMLPLLAQGKGTSIVVVPYTSLGFQGERRSRSSCIAATFLCSETASYETLNRLNANRGSQIIYICPEMLETPKLAQLLSSEQFRAQLSGIYIDEAHTIHESVSWRPANANLHMLRRVIGLDVPLIVISATLPSKYRKSLEVYAGLRSQYHLIHLGNFRPELSVIRQHMKHPKTSFLDLAFLIPLNATDNDVPPTIVYSDDLNLLTAMFWWFHFRLSSAGLSPSLVDILHAGLSNAHQKICLEDFIDGRTRILLGSDKIGAGMDFPHVRVVIQYGCQGLTLVRWEQRRGRGARRSGMTAVGILLVEKSMAGEEEKSPTIRNPRTEDPGLVELAQTSRCLEQVTNIWLENPSSTYTSRCERCSNCNPALKLPTPYTFVHEMPQSKSATQIAMNSDTVAEIHNLLLKWQGELWRREWKDEWPSYGPECLVTDSGLLSIAKNALKISTADDLYNVTPIIHLDDLAPSLLQTLENITRTVCGTTAREQQKQIEEALSRNSEQVATPSSTPSIEWAPLQMPCHFDTN
ncbi:ATP-dependent DNA helicase [Coprinopsis cinerea okayama7|uniref:DNA 3'-5' helicase n=1 Tax=Coprinopsis cinerea (strain Okayama-7 / 130 / ATCC MYA-4618 / FGSC 9003) TaxID=240176 RepID=A8N581_COPC7|nr:ATP-dependent DNA helicase [Coprinopsis cinerea okayama7\|eukprot:XP_001830030.2 ATP-dependent DNA helicase [Coprinopsis cinerea okayama7\